MASGCALKNRGQHVGGRLEMDLGGSIGPGQLFERWAGGRKSATAAAMTATSASTPAAASAISWADSTVITFTAGWLGRSARRDQGDLGAAASGFVGDGMPHLSR